MHIVVSVLGAILTALYILERLGIDVGIINPWSWRRRRAWARRYHGDPIYSVEDPMDVAALLVIGSAKLDGDVTAEQKRKALNLFESTFSLDAKQSAELYGAAAHLLGSHQVIDTQLQGVLAKNKHRFTQEQALSIIEIAGKVAAAGGSLSERQQAFLTDLSAKLAPPATSQNSWS